MQRELLITKDGSHTISIPELNVTYHSVHGAIQESMLVFIEAGYYGSERRSRSEPFNILEFGFGTGLNALLTLIESEKNPYPIYYQALELNPLNDDEVAALNYCKELNRLDLQTTFEEMHSSEWEKDVPVSKLFVLRKSKYDITTARTQERLESLELLEPLKRFDLVYFDAFAPSAQPELWKEEVFKKLYSVLTERGILVTYCSKSVVRRAMQAAGFKVEKIPGPRGKREMLRAVKL